MSESKAKQLEELDAFFLDSYATTRRALVKLQQERALLVVNGDQMLLFHGGGGPEVIPGLRPPVYTRLKTLSHVPLAIYALLTLEAGTPSLSRDTLLALSEYHTRLDQSAAALDTRDLVESGDLPQPVTIFDRTLAFIDTVLAQEQVAVVDLQDFVASMAPDIRLLFAAAAKAQIDAVHQRIVWLRESVLSPQEWQELRVVVMGAHMAHKDDLFLQYFSRALDTPKYTEKRLVYFEGEDQDAAIDLLGTVLIDTRASRAFFMDETRLHRDVLGDATRRYLQELIPEEDV